LANGSEYRGKRIQTWRKDPNLHAVGVAWQFTGAIHSVQQRIVSATFNKEGEPLACCASVPLGNLINAIVKQRIKMIVDVICGCRRILQVNNDLDPRHLFSTVVPTANLNFFKRIFVGVPQDRLCREDNSAQ